MDGVYTALRRHFGGFFTDFLGSEAKDAAIIFENSDIVKKRYLDGGCEYLLRFKLTFRGFFGRDEIKNAENRNRQEQLAFAVINGNLPALPDRFKAVTLDVASLTADCIDIRGETARYCVDCRFTFFGEG